MHVLYAIIFLPGKVINFFKSLHSELLKLLQTGLCTSIIDVGYLGANLSELGGRLLQAFQILETGIVI